MAQMTECQKTKTKTKKKPKEISEQSLITTKLTKQTSVPTYNKEITYRISSRKSLNNEQ
jgi:hypothetical protein